MRIASLLLAAFVGWALLGCSSPMQQNLGSNTTGTYTGPAGTGGLSFKFSFKPSAARGITSVTVVPDTSYLTVQLYSDSQKAAFFQAATFDAEYSASVAFTGLIPGIWDARAQIYDSEAGAILQYFGSSRIAVTSGLNPETVISMYEVGSVPISATGGIYADNVSVVDLYGNSSAVIIPGSGYQLMANLTTISDGIPDQQVLWGSNAPSVATVDQSGKVKAVSYGTASITATARYGGISGSFELTVAPAYVGSWAFNDGTYSTVFSIDSSNNFKWYDWSPDYGDAYSYAGSVQISGSGSLILNFESESDPATASGLPIPAGSGYLSGYTFAPWTETYSFSTSADMQTITMIFQSGEGTNIIATRVNNFVHATPADFASIAGTMPSSVALYNATAIGPTTLTPALTVPAYQWVIYGNDDSVTPIYGPLSSNLGSQYYSTLLSSPITFGSITNYSYAINAITMQQQGVMPYKLRLVSLSDPTVFVDFDITVSGSGSGS
jgi:hypothetical protein